MAQARISFIKVGEIPFHFKTGWVDKNPFTATTNKHWWPSRHHWKVRGGPLIHWRWCVPSPLSLCLYLHWYLISLSFRCLPQQPALCVASEAQAPSQPARVTTKNIFFLLCWVSFSCELIFQFVDLLQIISISEAFQYFSAPWTICHPGQAVHSAAVKNLYFCH